MARIDCRSRPAATIIFFSGRTSAAAHRRRLTMAWKAPKVEEVQVGMEINMYACATRK
jgi:coenzyme PQQ precursor peptide PqqA